MSINNNVAIVLKSLTKPSVLSNGFTYSDLHLDIQYQYLVNHEVQRQYEITDILVDYDLGAIRNSIVNLLLTFPGQKILNPFFGLNLAQYLFQPCDEDTAFIIGQEIQKGITTFEPRVKINLLKVIAQPATHSFQITLILSVPTLNSSSFQIAGTLSNSGFYIN